MSALLPHVAIVGRPNVGKSRLFNRLAGRRISIVHDQPGVTRDVIAEDLPRLGITLLDTGGIGITPEMTPQNIHEATEAQVDFAIQAASLILFVCDAREGWTTIDADLAAQLRTSGKPILLVTNKADTPALAERALAFCEAGLGDPLAISAEHDLGIAQLEAAIVRVTQATPQPEVPDDTQALEARIPIAIIGRPNVGKSSLGNRLLNSPTLVVSPVAGTTRDAVARDLDHTAPDGSLWRFRLVDTAGLRAHSKIDSVVEKFSSMRTGDAIANAEIVLLILDAKDGITQFEKKIAGDALKAGKALIIVVNKWDYAEDTFARTPLAAYRDLQHFRKDFEEAVRRELFFAPAPPFVFLSAQTGKGTEQLLPCVRATHRRLVKKLPTPRLNQTLQALLEKQAPSIIEGFRFKIYYAVHTRTLPHAIKIFCNRAAKLQEHYKRYLETGLIRAFELDGCPLRLELIGKEPRQWHEKPETRGRRKRPRH